jgi:hypothetical protein
MKTPHITLCCDGHLRRVIYGVGPYIADYPEQALLACVVQGWCPKYVFLPGHYYWQLIPPHSPFNSDALPHIMTSRESLGGLVHTFSLRR